MLASYRKPAGTPPKRRDRLGRIHAALVVGCVILFNAPAHAMTYPAYDFVADSFAGAPLSATLAFDREGNPVGLAMTGDRFIPPSELPAGGLPFPNLLEVAALFGPDGTLDSGTLGFNGGNSDLFLSSLGGNYWSGVWHSDIAPICRPCTVAGYWNIRSPDAANIAEPPTWLLWLFALPALRLLANRAAPRREA